MNIYMNSRISSIWFVTLLLQTAWTKSDDHVLRHILCFSWSKNICPPIQKGSHNQWHKLLYLISLVQSLKYFYTVKTDFYFLLFQILQENTVSFFKNSHLIQCGTCFFLVIVKFTSNLWVKVVFTVIHFI